MSFINDQLTAFLNNHLKGVGTVTALNVGRDHVSATLELLGENTPLQLSLTGICWDAGDGLFNLNYAAATASKPWMQGLLNLLGERRGNKITIHDKLSLMPVKMMFPKKGAQNQ